MSKKAQPKARNGKHTPEKPTMKLDPQAPSKASSGPPGGGDWEEVHGFDNTPIVGFVSIAPGVQLHARLKRVIVQNENTKDERHYLLVTLATGTDVQDREQGEIRAEAGDLVGINYAACLRPIVDRGEGVEFWVEFGEKTTTKRGKECHTLAKQFVRGRPQQATGTDNIPF